VKKVIVPLLALCFGIGILAAAPAAAEEHTTKMQCFGIGGQDMVTATKEIDGIIVEITFVCVNVEADIDVTVTVGDGLAAAAENSISMLPISGGMKLMERGSVMGPLGDKEIDEEYIPINGDFPKHLEELIKFRGRGDRLSMFTRRYKFLVEER